MGSVDEAELPRLSRNAAAVLWVAASVALFTLIYAAGKLTQGRAGAFQIIWLYYAGCLATLLLALALRGRSPNAYRTARPFTHIARILLGSTGGAATVFATAKMPVADATAIGLLDGVFIALLGVLVLGERIGARHAFAILLCIAGAGVVVAGRGAFAAVDRAYLVPATAAFAGALLIAFESLLIKRLVMAETPFGVMLHKNAFGVAILAPSALMDWRPIGLADLGLLLAFGPIGIVAQYFTLRGYALADTTVVGPAGYTWIVFAVLLGFAAFGEVPTPWTLLG